MATKVEEAVALAQQIWPRDPSYGVILCEGVSARLGSHYAQIFGTFNDSFGGSGVKM